MTKHNEGNHKGVPGEDPAVDHFAWWNKLPVATQTWLRDHPMQPVPKSHWSSHAEFSNAVWRDHPDAQTDPHSFFLTNEAWDFVTDLPLH
ncbi:hypothetical protein [Lysinibacter sp. HNR]|uniref:hypothetical protein n=1 Tax=Lysinibacter sp. HNR TaxID=3031408 RepID=UPI0024354624|nr:hypothetical protein [Lysinibacter sp. HNR]WGD37781.1 hypothetical protein FrondiHNR_02380 [Lysinibacter sp. HNR]